jgi:hypothetical protein
LKDRAYLKSISKSEVDQLKSCENKLVTGVRMAKRGKYPQAILIKFHLLQGERASARRWQGRREGEWLTE